MWYAAETRAVGSSETLLEVKAFELKGQIEDLEEQKLDFRYSPKRWQACIGLPDDPHKSIVGSDGGLYYDYGGGRFYDFNVRVVAAPETRGFQVDVKQRLLGPRIRVVITEQRHGGLLLRRRAWAGAPKGRGSEQWSKKRIDYWWLEVENLGSTPQRGRIVLKIDSDELLQVSQDMQRVHHVADELTFCMVSPKCALYSPKVSEEGKPTKQILPRRLPAVSRNWGKLDIAMGTMMSEPRPVEVRTGIGARIVVAVVIRHGRTIRIPAHKTARRVSSALLGVVFSNDCLRYVHITTPSSEAMPNSARKPTQIASLRLIGRTSKSARIFTRKIVKLRNQSCA